MTQSSARACLFEDGLCILRGADLTEVVDRAGQCGGTVWLDVQAPGPDELKILEAAFELHELAVSAVSDDAERPRLSVYPGHLFLTVSTNTVLDGRASTDQIAAFVLPTALITLRRASTRETANIAARWREHPIRAEGGVAVVVYLLLDEVVNGHLDTLQELDERVDDIEEEMFEGTDAAGVRVQRQLFALRKELVRLRRAVLPMREMLLRLLRQDTALVPAPLTTYFQDVHDQVVRLGEWSELLRELVASVVETNLTIQSNRTNVTMKKVTGWAAIVAVPTLITGYYGQNVPYPGAGETSGVVTSLLLMVVSAVLLYFVFRRNDWL